jgi:hypothetical protein
MRVRCCLKEDGAGGASGACIPSSRGLHVCICLPSYQCLPLSRVPSSTCGDVPAPYTISTLSCCAGVLLGAVLLKNEAPPGRDAPMLPLDAARLNKLCVTGPLSDSPEHQMGNYYGRFDSKATSTPLSGLQSALGA